MNQQHDNGNGFKTPEGKRLGAYEASHVRIYSQKVRSGVVIMFDRINRMPENDEWHPNPTATYGSTAVAEATNPQTATEESTFYLEDVAQQAAAESAVSNVVSLDAARVAKAHGEDVTNHMTNLQQDAQNKINEAYQNDQKAA
jgi:hypothetical protein